MSFLSHLSGPPPVLRCKAPDADLYIRPQDQEVFAKTAWWFNVHIAVRRSNPKSVELIGHPGMEPKGPDTKAKTCQFNVPQDNGRLMKVAGLVADPTIVGPMAYAKGKYDSAMREWAKFLKTGRLDPDVTFDSAGQPNKYYLLGGHRFFVDKDPNSPRYGALKRSRTGLVTAANYIHGDYDLFAIIPADNPSQNIVVSEQHLSSPTHALNKGQQAYQITGDPDDAAIPNYRGQKFMDVQNRLNHQMGVTMILHGSQEKAVNSFNEEVDVYLANGEESFSILKENHLQYFYEVVLGGRQLHNFIHGPSAGACKPVPGTRWQTLGTRKTVGAASVDQMEHRANWMWIR